MQLRFFKLGTVLTYAFNAHNVGANMERIARRAQDGS